MHDIWNPWHGCVKCSESNVTFVFCGTGRRFVKDNRLYKIEKNFLQSQQTFKSGLNFQGKPIEFKLYDKWGRIVSDEELYKPYYRERCQTCSMKLICNGCSQCGKCDSFPKNRGGQI